MICTQQFVDCSMYGGYAKSDPCRHTCNSQVPVRPMLDTRRGLGLQSLQSFQLIEARPREPIMCTMQYVHCPYGYDPIDPCNHTCLKPEVEMPVFALINLNKQYDGSVFDMGTVYNGDQGVITLANTGDKNQVNFDKIEAGAGSTTVFMH